MNTLTRPQLIIFVLSIGFFAMGLASFNYKVPDVITNEPTLKDVEIALNNLASNKTFDLVTNKNWEHTNFDGCDFGCRVGRFAVEGWVGENLYKGTTCNIRFAIELWEKSPKHKAVLDHDYDYGSIQIYRSDKDNCYIVLNVAK